ncbi:hypothetical protein ACIRST_33540 [Kitasatospora sp. NPDC101447]|uniref:effector-associated constant component EACC1 n=1 Tax=unclassified Kitasatospora TaxID=2633591 RepID=UPI0037C67F19
MDARIAVTGGDEVRETAELWEWLRHERELVGLVRAVPTVPAEGELGGAVEVLEVALGSGGAGAVLAGSLSTWLRTRRTDVTVIVTTPARRVELDVRGLKPEDVAPLLREVLSGGDD